MKRKLSFLLLNILVTALLTGGTWFVLAKENQPSMREALQRLRAARMHLTQATNDKGGHKKRALNLVNQAIAEVELGIGYDNTH